MDYYDRSQRLEQIQRDEAIARQRARFAEIPGIPGAAAALDCLECGNEIPAARRAAVPGTFYCVDASNESKKKGNSHER